MIDLSLGIVTFNSAAQIGSTLDSILRHWPAQLTTRLYIIDNQSTDETLAIVSRYAEQYPDAICQLVSPPRNIGFGRAHNLVLEQLDSRNHIIINPDIILHDATALPQLASYLDSHPDAGIVMPRIVDQHGQNQYLARRQLNVLDLLIRFYHLDIFPAAKRRLDRHTMRDQDYRQPFDIEFASGCLLAIRTSVFRRAGGFDPRYFLYAEDADLTRQVIMQLGLRAVCLPAVTVEHGWSRASYRRFGLFLIHARSIRRYFQKWGIRWC